MSTILGDLLLRVRGDSSEGDDVLGKTKERLKGLLSPANILKGAIMGAGLAMDQLAKQVIPLNQSLDRAASTSGIASSEMRELALELTNVTFPLDQVTGGMEALAERGVRSLDEMGRLLPIFDKLADALGSDVPGAIELSDKALGAMGLSIEDMDENMAATIFAVEKLTREGMAPLNRIMSMMGPEIKALGLDFDDMATIMLGLDRNTGSAREAQALLRDAIAESDGNTGKFMATIRRTTGDLTQYGDEIARGSELIEEHAAINTRHLGTWAKMKQRFQEIVFANGEMIEKMGQFGMVVAGVTPMLGPLGRGISGVGNYLKVGLTPGLLGAAKSVWAFTTALLANPITWVIVGIVALITAIYLLWKNWDRFVAGAKTLWAGFKKFFVDLWESISKKVAGVWTSITDAVKKSINAVLDMINFLIRGINKIPGINIGEISKMTLSTDIPKFHGGGVYRAPTPGGEGLAWLKDREVVSTPGAASGAGDTYNITLNVDAEDIDSVQKIIELFKGLQQSARAGLGVT